MFFILFFKGMLLFILMFFQILFDLFLMVPRNTVSLTCFRHFLNYEFLVIFFPGAIECRYFRSQKHSSTF